MADDFESVFVCSQQSPSPSQDSQATPPALSNVRRKRSGRANYNQLETLISHIEARPLLFTRRILGRRDKYDSAWREITADLNSLGTFKTPEQWITVWRDLKSRACMKAAKSKKDINKTGNSETTPELTDIEQRIVSLIGAAYNIGTNCPESMPEEDTVQSQSEAVLTEATDEPEIIEEITENVLNQETIPPASSQPQLASSNRRSNAPAEYRKRIKTSKFKYFNPRRSISEQHSVARNDFLAVAESNAESVRMLADTIKSQAESAKVQAEASLLFAQATNKIADALIKFAEIKNS